MKRLLLVTAGALILGPFGMAMGQSAYQSPQPYSVHAAQVRLRGLGMYRGMADGDWDQATQAAVKRFQKSAGLAQNGQLDVETRSALSIRPDSEAD